MPTSICVFCGASPGASPAYAEAASELGRAIAGAGMRLIYGGGSVGLITPWAWAWVIHSPIWSLTATSPFR